MKSLHPSVEDLTARIAAGEALGAAWTRVILDTTDLIALGMLAEAARRRRHGDRVTFVRVHDIRLDQAAGWNGDVPDAAGEIRISGTPSDRRRTIGFVRQVAARCPGVPLTGFSLADLEAAPRIDGRPLVEWLEALRDAGLDGVSEAPLDRLAAAEESLTAVVRAGLEAPRLVLAHGSIDDFPACAGRAAALQRALGAIRVAVPLAASTDPARPATGYDEIRRVALARLLIDNIDSIQVDWATQGPKLAQVALAFGADDVDRVSAEGPGPLGRRHSPLEEIQRNIRAASLLPIERNGRFQPLTP